jgi:hypothetical protein
VSREHRITEAFISLANNLVDDFDVVDLLSGLTSDCADILDVASAGVLLADRRRVLHVIAASSEATWKLELFQLQRDEGPCLDCYRAGFPVAVADLGAARTRWPRFVAAALDAGFLSVHAVPMRINDSVLGTLGLFGTHVGALAADDLLLAQALAHVGSVAIVSGRHATDAAAINEQLQHALGSRVVIEQAKGLLAEHLDLSMEDAFAALRSHARSSHERITDVAVALIERRLRADDLVSGRRPGTPERPVR